MFSEERLDQYLRETLPAPTPEHLEAVRQARDTMYLSEEAPSDFSVSVRAKLLGLAALSAVVVGTLDALKG